jgi:type I pantothenate kinase
VPDIDPSIERLGYWVAGRIPADGLRPYLVGIAGSVAVGKSRVAEELATVLSASRRVEVVTTDGFLFPNAELADRGLEARKGFPETYDVHLLEDFLRRIRAGEPEVPAPVYSHELYDVLPTRRMIERPDVLVLEGVNVLQPGPAALLDLRIYVDADTDDILHWYVERFLRLRAAAVDDESSFFRRFSGGEDADATTIAELIWQGINAPNLVEHILPTRDHADVVVRKGADHRVVEVRLPE